MIQPIANAALHFHPADYGFADRKITGRLSATRGFLDAFLVHAEIETAYCFTPDGDCFQTFQDHVARLQRPLATKFIPFRTPGKIADVGCLYRPDPGIAQAAWRRRLAASARDYSICGITHTHCSGRVMDALGALLTAPVQPWDAVICTSQAVKESTEFVIDQWRQYLESRLGATAKLDIRLPIIPLGIETSIFEKDTHADNPNRLQQHLQENETVALYVGRLSHTQKSHPLPMLLALERAAVATQEKIHLLLVGWFKDDATAQQFEALGRTFAPSVRLTAVNGRKSEVVSAAWQVADIFISLSDNIQETFGLTPIEAMAAGLPVVVSDWNGYKETVRHGIDGFRVPTRLPPPGTGRLLAQEYASQSVSYEAYIGSAAHCCSVCVESCAKYLTELIRRPELRQQMGAAGRAHARDKYDWVVIIRQYQQLWNELAEVRIGSDEIAPVTPQNQAHPLRQDPFTTFRNYSTSTLNADTVITLNADVPVEKLVEPLRSNKINRPLKHVIVPWSQVTDMVARLSGGIRIADLASGFPQTDAGQLYRTIAWLLKFGVACVVDEADEP